MGSTYKYIAAVTAGSGGTSSIDFTNIPQTYDNLLIHLNSRNSRSSNGPGYGSITLNGSSSGFYNSYLGQYNSGPGDPGGIGVGLYSSNYFTFALGIDAMSSSSFGTAVLYIPSYTNAYSKIVYVDACNGGSATTPFWQQAGCVAWSGTAAITSVSITTGVDAPFKQYTTAHLYGIKNS